MKKLFCFVFYLIIILSLVACGSKTPSKNETVDSLEVPAEDLIDITEANLKQSKQELLQKMANDLYLEAEKEIEAAPAVKMDQENIYDDIKPVEVVIETDIAPSFDLGIEVQDEAVVENKKED